MSDNGPGSLEDIREKMFEPFYATKPTGSRTGLGLNLSNDIVTPKHWGSLALLSGDQEEGATFVVRLTATG